MKTLNQLEAKTVAGGVAEAECTVDKIKKVASNAKKEIEDLVQSSLDKAGENANKVADKINDWIEKE